MKRHELYSIIIAVLALVIAPLLLAGLWFTQIYIPDPVDFGAYWHAGLRARLNLPLYTPSNSITTVTYEWASSMKYLYPPSVVVIFIPFSYLTISNSILLWEITSIIFFLGSVYYMIQKWNVLPLRKHRAAVIILALCFRPVIHGLYLGQITVILVGILCLAGGRLGTLFSASGTPNEYVTGILLMLPAIIKPPLASANAVSLYDKKRIVGGIIAICATIITSIGIFGFQTSQDYITVLFNGKGWGGELPNLSQGGFSPYYIIYDHRFIGILAVLFVTISLSLIVVYKIESKYSNGYLFSFGITAIPLIHPTVNLLTLAFTFPAIALVLILESKRKDGKIAIPLLALVLVQIHIPGLKILAQVLPALIGHTTLIQQSLPYIQPALYGVVLLYGFVIYRLFSPLEI